MYDSFQVLMDLGRLWPITTYDRKVRGCVSERLNRPEAPVTLDQILPGVPIGVLQS